MSRRRGFSLVELLIALAIIMAIVTIATGIFQPLIAEQSVDVLKANLRAVRQALLEFYNDHGRYPFEGQDEFGNVVTFLDDSSSELVQGRHSGAGTYPDTEAPDKRYPRRRYLMNMPGDPTLESNQIGWKLIFRETFNINDVTRAELLAMNDFSEPLVDWIMNNRPFSSTADVLRKIDQLPKDDQPAKLQGWGRATAIHDIKFSGNPLRVRVVTNVKSLNPSYAEL